MNEARRFLRFVIPGLTFLATLAANENHGVAAFGSAGWDVELRST